MSDVFWHGFFVFWATVVVAWMQRRTQVAVTGVKATTEKLADSIEQVHIATNGMKDQLVKEVRKASFAAGVKSEKDHPGEGQTRP